MDDKTCKTCRWWKSGVCDLIDLTEEGSVSCDDAAILVGADDDSGLYAQFRTGPDFGCVKWTQKSHGLKQRAE